ncbi:hypothetical protein VTN77DRAFT_3384 [Rasamsonia byssochlamydoides]|uniref:uncharacterized protein n=1 Tax=Rasamsonia byssochlamydoides TaxID=89139 RepID=UPI0037437F09
MQFVVGTKVEFAEASSTWILSRELDHKMPCVAFLPDFGTVKEALEEQFVFLCDRDGSAPKEWAVIKITTLTLAPGPQESSGKFEEVRKFVGGTILKEIKALAGLAKSGCKSAPKLITQKQSPEENLHIWFILMTQCPGVPLGEGPGARVRVDPFWDKNRDNIRKAFKEDLDCVRCGWLQTDPGRQNLLWDRNQNKCWFVDWDAAVDLSKSKGDIKWSDVEYFRWGLVRGGDENHPAGWEW